MLARALAGIWEFVVGDDWRTAAGVVLTLAAVALVAAAGLPAWWIAPPATLAVLYRSIWRASSAK